MFGSIGILNTISTLITDIEAKKGETIISIEQEMRTDVTLTT